MHILDIEIADTHEYKPGSDPRSRDIGIWSLSFREDLLGKWVSLTGVVLRGENERPLAEGANVRITSTSPIASVDKRTVTTNSGSKYTLIGEPSPHYLLLLQAKGLKYDPENPIPMSLIAGE